MGAGPVYKRSGAAVAVFVGVLSSGQKRREREGGCRAYESFHSLGPELPSYHKTVPPLKGRESPRHARPEMFYSRF